jgi:hypothetical protein
MVVSSDVSKLYQIFFPCQKFDTVHNLELLVPFYLHDKKNETKNEKPKEQKNEKPKNEKPINEKPKELIKEQKNEKPKNEKPKIHEFFFPNRNNSLFWCLFIKKYGFEHFYSIQKQKLATTELSEQSKIAEFLGKPESSIKKIEKPKITKKYIQELRSDLMVMDKNKNALALLPAYALFYDCCIVVVFNEHLFLEITSNDPSNKEIYIYTNSHHRFGIKNY